VVFSETGEVIAIIKIAPERRRIRPGARHDRADHHHSGRRASCHHP
jgi:hypothetical protein